MSKKIYEFNLTKIEKCKIYNDLTQEFLNNKNIKIKDEYWQSIYNKYICLTKEPLTNGYNHIVQLECDSEYFENYKYQINKYSSILVYFDNIYNTNNQNMFDLRVG